MKKIIIAILYKELELQCNIKLRSIQPATNGGSTSDTFIIETVDSKKYTVKFKPIDFKCKKYINTLYALNRLEEVFPHCIKCYFSVIGKLCIVTEWVKGSELLLADFAGDIIALNKCTACIASSLKKIHTLSVKDNGRVYSMDRNIVYSKKNLQRYRIKLPHMQDFLEFIDNSTNIPKSKERIGYVHFDLHIKNIIRRSDLKYSFIDWEIAGISDVWCDFVYAVCINHPDEHFFWLLFILNYFKHELTLEFFKVTKFYVVLFMLMLAKSNYKSEHLESYYMLAEKVFKDYGNLKCNVPYWIKSASEKLLAYNTDHDKQLRMLIRWVEEERNENSCA